MPERSSGTGAAKEEVPNSFGESLCLSVGSKIRSPGTRSSNAKRDYLSFGLASLDICRHELAVGQFRAIKNANSRAARLRSRIPSSESIVN
jgi:hypothetical protein